MGGLEDFYRQIRFLQCLKHRSKFLLSVSHMKDKAAAFSADHPRRAHITCKTDQLVC